MVERRERYRISGVDKSSVLVAIIWPDDQIEDIRLLDASAGGLKFALKERSLTSLKVGQELTLTLKLTSVSPATRVGVVIRRIQKGMKSKGYACEFIDNSGLVKAKSARLWQLFNRRSSFRVSPPSGKSCPIVQIITGGKSFKGNLWNISTDGLAMVGSGETSPEIGQSAKLSFVLMKPKSKLIFRGEIRHQTATKGKFVLGVQFDPNLPGAINEQLSDYVSTRQIVMIDDRNDD